MASVSLVNSLVKNQLFKTAPYIDEPPFQSIHTMDLSVVDTMLHDSPDLIIHRTDILALWRPQVGRKKVWRFLMQQFSCCTCAAQCAVHCPAGTQSRIAGNSMTSLWSREAALKKSIRDTIIISCFVTTMKFTTCIADLLTVFVKKCTQLHFSR